MSDKEAGLNRVSNIESNDQKKSDSGVACKKFSDGAPATKSNPTSNGKIKR